MSVKALKRALKKAGLKTSGRKSALTKRAKKAHLMRGGAMACYTNGTKNSKTEQECKGKDDEWKDDGMMDVEDDVDVTPGDNPPPEGGRSRRRRNRSRRGIFGKLF